MLIELAFIVAFVWFVWKIVGSRKDPIEILKARYAKGLITKKEFAKMKRELGG